MKRVWLLLLCACSGGPEPGGASPVERVIGTSVEGRPIRAVEYGSGPEITLILAGVHGNETTAIEVAQAFCKEMRWQGALLDGRRVVVVPIVNPDGYARKSRHNARGVDLNRNFSTRDWGGARFRPGDSPASEPETQAILGLLETLRPAKILSLHDPLRVNNYDGAQSADLARAMAAFNGYPVKGSIGYATPGSLGTWAGVERKIRMVTLEIPNGDLASRWRENKWALVAAVRHR